MAEIESAREVKAPFYSHFDAKLGRRITIFAHCSFARLQIKSQQLLYIKPLAAAQGDAKLFHHNVVTTPLACTPPYQLKLRICFLSLAGVPNSFTSKFNGHQPV